jgi:hypothetical protein
MCTLTWSTCSHGYDVYFNRDESIRRLPALPPTVTKTPAGRFLAPTDRDAGGTWIGVNSQGITVCILNYYTGTVSAPPPQDPHLRSRGFIVRDSLSRGSAREIRDYLDALDLSRYRPFQVVVFAPEDAMTAEPVSFLWTGRDQLVVSRPAPPVSSSGFDPQNVIARRRKLYQEKLQHWREKREGPPDHRFFYDYHADRTPGEEAYSVCMERSNARTMSFTHISVRGQEAEMVYSGDPLCFLTDAGKDGERSQLPVTSLPFP